MGKKSRRALCRRELQVLEAVCRRQEADTTQIQAALQGAPGYSAVRSVLKALESKGLITRRREGRRYVYAPTLSRETASRSAVGKLLNPYVNDSVAAALAAVLRQGRGRLSEAECQKLFEILGD